MFLISERHVFNFRMPECFGPVYCEVRGRVEPRGNIPDDEIQLLFGQRNLEDFALHMFAADDVLHLCHDVGVLHGHIVVFVQVGGQIVEPAFALLHHQFPVTHAHGHHVRFVEFPVEESVLPLSGLSEERRCKGDAVETVAGESGIHVPGVEILDPRHLAEGGQDVVERQLVGIHRLRCHLPGPPCDEGNAYAAFVGAALLALEQSVAVDFVFLLRTSAIQTSLMALGLASDEAIFCLSYSRFLFFKYAHSGLCKCLKNKKMLCERWKSGQADTL